MSPFKVESSSTPKSSRIPLRDNSIEVINIRRRLTSLNTSTNIINTEENKENNDSAIGKRKTLSSQIILLMNFFEILLS